jgi:hypothetical protein
MLPSSHRFIHRPTKTELATVVEEHPYRHIGDLPCQPNLGNKHVKQRRRTTKQPHAYVSRDGSRATPTPHYPFRFDRQLGQLSVSKAHPPPLPPSDAAATVDRHHTCQ